MRLRSAFLLATLLALAPAASREAQAVVSVDIIWTSTTGSGTTGGSTISAAPGDTLVAEIRIHPDGGGLGGYSFSLEFDPDLGNELDLVSVTELLGVMEFNLNEGVDSTQESTPSLTGKIEGIEAVTRDLPGPTSGTVIAAEVTFSVTSNVATDGNDVFVGEFETEGDIVFDNAFAIVTPSFSHASVNLAQPMIPALSPLGLMLFGVMLVAAMYFTLRRTRLGRSAT